MGDYKSQTHFPCYVIISVPQEIQNFSTLADILQTTFWFRYQASLFLVVKLNYVIIGSGNEFPPVRRQSLTWTSDDTVRRSTCESLGPKVSTRSTGSWWSPWIGASFLSTPIRVLWPRYVPRPARLLVQFTEGIRFYCIPTGHNISNTVYSTNCRSTLCRSFVWSSCLSQIIN